ncbi:MAG TPA: SHOCT domain-containing protein [Xanthobacteraceae bacterium]|nr:SHOCT domain-containing protein [Xanthobacteraceae bacterium]
MYSDGLTIVSQRSIAGGATFRFNERHLDYFGREWDFKAKYEEIVGPAHYRRSKTPDRPATLALMYLSGLAVVLLLRDHQPHYGPEGWHWFMRAVGGFIAVAVAICATIRYATHQEYTLVPTRSGNIVVVKGKQHDAIIAKLQACRLDGLRRLAAPNSANSPGEELAKLKWLRDEGAISDADFQQRCAAVAT